MGREGDKGGETSENWQGRIKSGGKGEKGMAEERDEEKDEAREG